MVTRLHGYIVGVLLALCCFSARAGLTNAVVFNLEDFTASPQAVRSLVLYPIGAPYTNGNGRIVTRDRVAVATGTNGSVTVSNIYGGTYRSELQGTTTITTNWFSFPTTNGTINASEWTIALTNGVSAANTAYSQSASDGRYVKLAGSTMTGGLTNSSGFFGDITGDVFRSSNGSISVGFNDGGFNNPAYDIFNFTQDGDEASFNVPFTAPQITLDDLYIQNKAVAISGAKFYGDGSGLTNLVGASSGALTNGDTRAISFAGGGVSISGLAHALDLTSTLNPSIYFHQTSGTAIDAYLRYSTPGYFWFYDYGNATNSKVVMGPLFADSLTGNGSGLTNLNSTNVTGNWNATNTFGNWNLTNAFGILPIGSLATNSPFAGGFLQASSASSRKWSDDGNALTNQNLSTATNLSISGLANAEYLDLIKAQESGDTFTNLNRRGWINSYKALRNGHPLRIMRVGDGLASGGHLAAATYRNLTNMFPVVGYMNTSFGFGEWQFGTSGTVNFGTGQDTYWYKYYAVIADVNGTVTFTNQTGGAIADTFSVVTMDFSGGGHMNVQTQINGGTWTTVSGMGNVSTVAGSLTATVRSFTGPRAATNIRVVGVDSGGVIYVLDASAIDSTATNGVIIGDYMGVTSATMAQMRPSANNITNAFTSWRPDLMLFQKIGIGDTAAPGTYTTTNFSQFFDFVHTAVPNCDVVFCSQYPVTTNNGGYNSDTEAITNTLTMRAEALQYGWSVFDGHAPFVDAQTMQNRGWIQGDQLHGTAAGYAAYDSLLTHWLALSDFGPGTNTFWPGLVGSTNVTGLGTAANSNATAFVLSSVNVTTNNATLTSGRVQVGDGGRGIANATASGAVPIDADGTATTFAQVNALPPGFIHTNGNNNALVIFTNNQVALSVNSSGIFTLTNYAAAGLGFVCSTNGSILTSGLTNVGGMMSSNATGSEILIKRSNAANGSIVFEVQNVSGTRLFGVSDTGVWSGSALVDVGASHDVSLSYNVNGDIESRSNGRIGFGSGSATSALDSYFERSAAGTILVDTNVIAKGTITATNGFTEQVVTKTLDYTATVADSIILINGATKTITLPTAVGNTGKTFTIKLIASGTTGTVATTSSQNIDGATTYSLSAQYKCIKVISDGTQWWVVSQDT